MIDKQELFAGYCAVWEYAESRLGYEVYEGPDMQDVCMSDVKEINICSRKGIEKKLYGLLHECGHALIRENWTKFQKEFPAHAACGYDRRKNRTDGYRVSLVEEEYEAWKRGKRLAKRLGIELDEERYEKHKTKCIMSYMHWAVGQYDI
mgnify:FL=1|jgi:hypothetical protein|tara:strand:+ start:4750 stop:5196 length:447 start_codon:yes stop_codon:yes gene_type:complete